MRSVKKHMGISCREADINFTWGDSRLIEFGGRERDMKGKLDVMGTVYGTTDIVAPA